MMKGILLGFYSPSLHLSGRFLIKCKSMKYWREEEKKMSNCLLVFIVLFGNNHLNHLIMYNPRDKTRQGTRHKHHTFWAHKNALNVYFCSPIPLLPISFLLTYTSQITLRFPYVLHSKNRRALCWQYVYRVVCVCFVLYGWLCLHWQSIWRWS